MVPRARDTEVSAGGGLTARKSGEAAKEVTVKHLKQRVSHVIRRSIKGPLTCGRPWGKSH